MKFKQFLHHLNHRNTRLFPKINSKFKITLFFLFFISLSFLVKKSIVLGETNTATLKTDLTGFAKDYNDRQNAVDNGHSLEGWTYEQHTGSVISGIKAFVNNIPPEVLSGKTTSWVPGGIIGFTTESIASLYNSPASGVEYIAQSVNSFMGKPAYAEENSFGFTKLKGVLNLWKLFRNSVYTLISLVFIITGIMIMLRVKISPQATISIQSSIPKLITTLILVTFSYAIAGLIIDFSYVVLGIVLSLINQNLQTGDTGQIKSLTDLVGNDISNLMILNPQGFFGIILTKLIPTGVILGICAILGTTIAAVVFTTHPVIGVLGGAIIIFSIFIYIFVQLVKFFFSLAKCYITLIIHIILAPIEIGIGALPNSKGGFSTWLKQIIANAIVFPASVVFIVFSVLLVRLIENTSNDGLWAPSILSNGTLISGLLGLVSLSLLSKLPSVVTETITGGKPSPFSKALGEASGTVFGMNAIRGVVGIGKESISRVVASTASEAFTKKTQGTRTDQTLGRAIKIVRPKRNRQGTPTPPSTGIPTNSTDLPGGA